MGPLIVEDSKGFTATWGDFSIRFKFKVDETPAEESAVVPYEGGVLSTIASRALTVAEYGIGAGTGGASAAVVTLRASTALSQQFLRWVVVPYCEQLGAVASLQTHILAATNVIWGPTVAGSMVGGGAALGVVGGFFAVYVGRNAAWPAAYWVGGKVAAAAVTILGRVGNWILVVINEKVRGLMGEFLTGSHAHLLKDGVQSGEL